MKRQAAAGFLIGCAAATAQAQTHAVKKPETVVRAVAVYEWTGDEAKPTASRLVPVSVFINSQLEDAGLYLARPVPFALDPGTIFEVQKAGLPEGTLQLAFERHFEGASAAPFDDGWIGYGAFKPKPQEVVVVAKKSGPLPEVVASGGTRPHFANKSDAASTATPPGTPAAAEDSSKPTMRRRDSSDTDSSKTDGKPADASGSTPVVSDDPNRPVLTRRSDASDNAPKTPPDATPSTTSASSDDANKPTMRRRTADTTDTSSDDGLDRPTLKKRTPAQSKAAQKKGDQASVTSSGSLNDDPDRPMLHRGAEAGPDIKPLSGLPADLKQMAAVSDAQDRPEHDFTRNWDSDAERAEVLGKMQEMARARLAKYDVAAPAAAAVVPPAPAAKPGARTRKAAAPPPPVALTLADESLRGYTLSYGGAATFFYTASSPGVGGTVRYVTVVAQREPQGELKAALSSVTDSNHLDRTPWMRLVDVVDAEASNRASLLLELRAQKARQFALYRVIGARAEQVFATGMTQ